MPAYCVLMVFSYVLVAFSFERVLPSKEKPWLILLSGLTKTYYWSTSLRTVRSLTLSCSSCDAGSLVALFSFSNLEQVVALVALLFLDPTLIFA